MRTEQILAPGRRIAGVLLGFAVLAGFFLHLAYVQRALPVAPYMDTLRVIALLDGWEAGRISLEQLWGVGSAHQGLIHEFFIYLNIKFLDYDALAANRATALVVALVAAVVGGAAVRWLAALSALSRVGSLVCGFFVVLVIPLQLFSWNGFEVLTLDLGLSLWVKNLAIVTCFFFYERFIRKVLTGAPVNGVAVASLSFATAAIVLVVAMGWSFAFTGALLVQLLVSGALVKTPRSTRLTVMLPVLTASAALGLYVWLSTWGGGSELVAGSARREFIPLLNSTAAALGSSLVGLEAARAETIQLSTVVLGGWLLIGLTGATFLVFGLNRLLPSTTLPVALIAYAGATAVALSVGRGGLGLEGVMASRYYMDLIFFPIGLTWLLLDAIGVLDARKRSFLYVLVAALLFGQLVAQGVAYRQEWKAAPYRKAVFEAMESSLEAHVPSEQEASLLQAPLKDARAASNVMQRWHIGPFKGAHTLPCSIEGLRYDQGWYAIEGEWRWTSGSAVVQAPGCSCVLRLATYLPEGFPARSLEVFVHGDQVSSVEMSPGVGQDIEIQLPANPARIELRPTVTSSPAKLGTGPDGRELGVYVGPPSMSCPVQGGP